MRGVVDGLDTAVPLGLQLPAVLQEDEFAQRFVSALDQVIAPVVNTLDDLDAYVSPQLAPDDFVDWLAGWVGIEFGDGLSVARRRDMVSGAVPTYRRDGTVQGMRDAVALATGGEVEIVESGGARWSKTPGTALPGDGGAALHVRVVVAEPSSVDARRLGALVAAIKPAHVVHTVEVVAR